ncbi:MAG: adenylosuccinate synthetase, partial [archaeon]
MPGLIVVGAQFGDEGKGKITDFLAKTADLVVRFQGGNNAGHTVCSDGKTLKLHHLPSGVLYEKKILIGAGCVVDPRVLVQEIENLRLAKIKLDLAIDPRCHIILPYHNLLDDEDRLAGGGRVGTTKRGIGPAYADKAMRVGIRFEDLISEKRLGEKLDAVFDTKKRILEKVYGIKVPF